MFARTVALTAAALASLAAASPSLALGNDEPRQVSVVYSGLDLTRQEGVDALQARLDRAVKRVCAAPDRNLRELANATRCRETASEAAANDMQLVVSRARAKVDVASSGAGARTAR